MKKYLALMFIPLALMFTACDGGSDSGSSTPVEAPDFPGVWTTDDKNQDASFVADIKDNNITVYWSDDENDRNEIYWSGDIVVDGDGLVSTADAKVMDESFISSTDKQKTFTLDGEHLTFPFEIGGLKQTVHLKKE